MARWRKNGGRSVAELPAWDRDPEGNIWTSLAVNDEGRQACGWADAGVPDQVNMAQARVVLARNNLLEDTDAWVHERGGDIEIFWFSRGDLRRNSPLLEEARLARGWSAEFVDQLFIEAEQVGL